MMTVFLKSMGLKPEEILGQVEDTRVMIKTGVEKIKAIHDAVTNNEARLIAIEDKLSALIENKDK